MQYNPSRYEVDKKTGFFTIGYGAGSSPTFTNLTVTNNGTFGGNLTVNGTGGVQLNSVANLTWGGAFGAGIPTIAIPSATSIGFYPTGSTSGKTFELFGTGNATLTGNLTVSGTGTSSFAGPVTGTSSTNGYQWTLTGSGIGGPSIALDATNATVANRYSGLTLYSGGTFQWGLQLRAGDGKFHIYDGIRGADALTVDVGPSSGVAGTTTVGGNLTVSGTGLSSVAGGLKAQSIESVGTPASYNTTGGILIAGYAGSSYALVKAYSDGSGTEKALTLQPGSGNVLVGTTTDSGQKLQVIGTALIAPSVASANIFFVRNTASNGYSTIQFDDTVGNPKGYIGYGNTGTSVFPNQFYIAGPTSIVLAPGGYTTGLTLDSSQNATFVAKATVYGILTTSGGSSDGAYGVSQYYGSQGATYPHIYRHKVETTHSANASNNKWKLSLCDGTTTGFIDSVEFIPSGAVFAGNIKTAAPSGGTAATWRLGTVATVSPTSPNRTIEVEIGGTTYYIHAKTTND